MVLESKSLSRLFTHNKHPTAGGAGRVHLRTYFYILNVRRNKSCNNRELAERPFYLDSDFNLHQRQVICYSSPRVYRTKWLVRGVDDARRDLGHPREAPTIPKIVASPHDNPPMEEKAQYN